MQSSLMVNLRVFLLELREDYTNSFRLNLQNPTLKTKIFSWIEKTFDKLQQDIEKQELQVALQKQIQQNI